MRIAAAARSSTSVIGHSPRHLDRNVTLVGRVVKGMELLSVLRRGTGALGFYEKPEERTPIRTIRVRADVPERERTPLEVLRTDTPTFAALVEARRNRNEEWFKYKAGRVEVCNVPFGEYREASALDNSSLVDVQRGVRLPAAVLILPLPTPLLRACVRACAGAPSGVALSPPLAQSLAPLRRQLLELAEVVAHVVLLLQAATPGTAPTDCAAASLIRRQIAPALEALLRARRAAPATSTASARCRARDVC